MSEAHIFIDGVIDDKMAAYVKAQLEANAGASKFIVHVSSPGGSVYQGYKIYHKLKSLNIPKEAIIEGECMSIATFVVMACDTVTALNPSRYMIHLPYMGLEGTSADLQNGARELQMIEQEIITAYKTKTGMDEVTLRQMMEKETYMSADEAREFGFVDAVDSTTLKAYAVGKTRKMEKNIFDNLSERITTMLAEVFGKDQPKNMDMQTDKGMLSIDAEDGVIEGKPATIGGQPAPDGDYVLEDGKVITVSGGMVAGVKEAAPPPPAPESPEEKQKKMEDELAALRAENESLKAAKAAEEQKVTAIQAQVASTQAQNTKAHEAMAMLKKEVEDLKKKTLGGDEPPKGPNAHKKEPVGESKKEYWQAETAAFIDEYLPHLKNLNVNK